MKSCQVRACDTAVLARGYCNRHYLQVKRHGKVKATIYEHRPAIIDGDSAKIPLGVGAKDGYFVVDKADAGIDQHKWSLDPNGYPRAEVDGRSVVVSRLLINPDQKNDVDHINGDTLNNRHSNLRECSRSQNLCNRKKRQSISGLRGVWHNKKSDSYYAYIKFKGAREHLGTFKTAVKAAKAYNERALELHGEFARLNNV